MPIHSNILAWKIPWTKQPGGLQFMWSQRVRHDLVTKLQQQRTNLNLSNWNLRDGGSGGKVRQNLNTRIV